MMKLPFVMYADLESILKPIDSNEGGEVDSWTTRKQEHIADGFAVYTKCSDPNFNRQSYVYTGENAEERFIDHVLAEAMEIRFIYKNKLTPIVTAQEHIDHNNADCCYICKGSFIVKTTLTRKRYSTTVTLQEIIVAQHTACAIYNWPSTMKQ